MAWNMVFEFVMVQGSVISNTCFNVTVYVIMLLPICMLFRPFASLWGQSGGKALILLQKTTTSFFFLFFLLRILNIFNTRTHGERGEGLKKTDSGIYSKSLTLGYTAQTRGTVTCVGECIHQAEESDRQQYVPMPRNQMSL